MLCLRVKNVLKLYTNDAFNLLAEIKLCVPLSGHYLDMFNVYFVL